MQCSPRCWSAWARRNALLIATMIAVVLGTTLGFGLRSVNLSYDALAWIKIWGELFMRMLKVIILPLVISCMVVGVSSMEGRASGRVGVVTLVYIMSTQVLGVLVGFVFTIAIHPGRNLENDVYNSTTNEYTSYTDVFGDFLRNIFPDNIVKACLESAYTDRTEEIIQRVINETMNMTENTTPVTRKLVYRSGTNMIGIIVFSITLGIGISVNGQAGEALLEVFKSLNRVIFSVMTAIIWYSPVGICSLIAGSILEVDDLENALFSLGMYVLTVLVSQVCYMAVILPLILLPILRVNVYKKIVHFFNAMLAAFAPPTSAAGLPYLLKDGVEKAHAEPRIVDFVAPVAVTLNRDGSSMFITTAAIFVAQTYGMTLSAADYFMVIILVSLLVSATAAVPSSSIVILLMVSEAVGIPVTERVGLLMTVEWLLDRVRTACNTLSHAMAIVVVDKFCRKHLSVACDAELKYVNIKENYPGPVELPLLNSANV